MFWHLVIEKPALLISIIIDILALLLALFKITSAEFIMYSSAEGQSPSPLSLNYF